MTAAENGRTLIRYKLSYPAADFVFDVATYSVSGVVGGLRPLRNVLRMRPLTSVADSVESFFNDLNIPHITYYRRDRPTNSGNEDCRKSSRRI